ncbi:hypothetical protein H2200_002146 [Cladophialophora chaetospira]|uniref:Uncharacterized protein n=1 Tax=Cladophialophora chaetospira TaxID=386627 RepID=A0AA38XIC4_9EURO|nr:hypothetical protein H2200_002146 [Cladophialophora chaetospira]
MSSLRSSTLPVLTGAMGTLGLATGLYSFSAPIDADRIFGIIVPKSVSSSKELQTWQAAQTSARGVRNVASGLAIIGITSFWQFSSLCQATPVASTVAKRCLGIVFLSGVITSAGDGIIITQFARGDSTSEEAKEVGKKAGFGHIVTTIPILALGVACFFT